MMLDQDNYQLVFKIVITFSVYTNHNLLILETPRCVCPTFFTTTGLLFDKV